jgi:tetratricopeptide (TPR) repeat protein
VWGDQYNRKLADLLEVQTEIAGEIAQHLQEKLGSGKRTAQKKISTTTPAVNPEAYRLYLQGVHHAYQWKEESLRQAIETFQRAITADSGYAPSHSGLAYTLAMVGFYGFIPPKQAYAQARAAANKALSLDASLAEAYVALSWVDIHFDHNSEAALKNIRKAIEINPNLAIARHGHALHLTVTRHPQEALVEIMKAVELDPLTLLFQAHHGWILHCLGRDKEALTVLLHAMDLNPTDYYVLRIILYTCKNAGRPDLALTIGEKAARMTSNKGVALGLRSFSYVQAGDNEKAEKTLAELGDEMDVDNATGYYRALVYASLGHIERAVTWLEKTAEEGTGIAHIVNAEPVFDGLRGEPRFEALMTRLGFRNA